MEKECLLFNNCNHKDCGGLCTRRIKTERMFALSLLSREQLKPLILRTDADGTDRQTFIELKDIALNIKKFVSDGKSLYIHSAVSGNGKSSWAIRLIKEYINNIWAYADDSTCHALFISVPLFLESLKNSINNYDQYAEDIKASVYTADVVVWDDIAAKCGTEYEINKLLSYIDRRINLGKSNIYTSNLGPNELSSALGTRLASRINSAKEIIFYGADKRKLLGGNN